MSEIDAQLFRSFSDGMPYGVCLMDVQSKIIYWNGAAEEITGYMGHEVLGRAYREDLLIHCGRSNGAEVQYPVTEVLREGRSVAAGLFLRHKLGHLMPIHVLAFPLRNSMGEMRGVGEILDPSHGSRENLAWGGRSDREFEIATGLPAVAECRQHLHLLMQSQSASASALILVEMSEQRAILQHGGTAMLHQALRTVAKTIAGLLPAHHFVGCWNDWRLLAIVPDCKPDGIETLRSILAGVGSACAVKWWGDRLVVETRAAARLVDPSKTVDAIIQSLEQDLKNIADREE